jgi:hypothetical protein
MLMSKSICLRILLPYKVNLVSSKSCIDADLLSPVVAIHAVRAVRCGTKIRAAV